MPRVAAIDCGTNSMRLLIADVDTPSRTLVDVVREMTIVRLGQGVDRTGMLAPEAIERAFAATESYAALCVKHNVEHIRFVATSASRDASNLGDFVSGVRARIGVEPEVISGQEEAELSFLGATGALALGHPGPYLVVDLGGGSTELVLGTEVPLAAHSMNVGCVRLTERHLAGDPPSEAEVAAAVSDVRRALDVAQESVPLGRTRTLVGVAGSVTTVTAQALGLEFYDPGAIDGAVLTIDEACAAATDLLARDRESRASLGFMHAGRVDVIGAGALVWREVMLRVRSAVEADGGTLGHVVTSEHDMLDGIAWALAGRAP